MTASASFPEIPDGISMSDLKKFLNQPQDDSPENTWDGKTEREIDEIAIKHIGQAVEEVETPLVHKAMVLRIIQGLANWHDQMSVTAMEQEAPEAAAKCQQAIGTLRAAFDLVRSVEVDENDFTVGE